jgi:cytochrome c-type biogenesis protein CcmE
VGLARNAAGGKPGGKAVKAKHQRLVLGMAALTAMIAATLLAISALSEQAAYFYAPGDLKKGEVPTGRAVRLGGMVQKKSIIAQDDGVSIHFVVEDGIATVPVRFTGIAPDLFKEGSGVVAEGRFEPDGSFVADNLLAKHDEKYMPPELKGKMHKTGKVSR